MLGIISDDDPEDLEVVEQDDNDICDDQDNLDNGLFKKLEVVIMARSRKEGKKVSFYIHTIRMGVVVHF